MARNMARIEDGIVVNIEWCSDDIQETDVLVNADDKPLMIGDTYEDGKFYREGAEVLSPAEMAAAENQDMKTALEILLGGEVV